MRQILFVHFLVLVMSAVAAAQTPDQVRAKTQPDQVRSKAQPDQVRVKEVQPDQTRKGAVSVNVNACENGVCPPRRRGSVRVGTRRFRLFVRWGRR